MKISFYGAARSVTGSRHVIDAGGTRLLLDCGLFQGRRQESDRLNRRLGFDPTSIDAVLLSHAHVDHSGALPVLAKGHFKGPVYMTDATADLTRLMLDDSARLQKNDCVYINKKERRHGTKRCFPSYTAADVRSISQRFISVPYGEPVRVTSRIKAQFYDAGHILGSASVWFKHSHRGNTRSVLFSGDLGRANMPVLRDPQRPPSCDVLIIESTYGDRKHEEDLDMMKRKALELIAHAVEHRSKIIVPAFAIGRTQDLVMRIKEAVQAGEIDPIPIFIDSPLASKATQVFRRHPECFDQETYRTFASQGDPFAAKYIRYVGSVKESQAMNTMRGPCVIISASGMCEGGRVLHHLKHAIQDEANIIALVGFQAEHTLGRKLIEEWDNVPIFGVPTPRRARVVRFNGLSAHADRDDLLAYVRAINPSPSQIYVVHGEERQSFSLASAIRVEHPGVDVVVPEPGATYNF
ncbi:MAG: MBL fold metallo-hydrolase [Nitrospirales bacterium]|nr:MBL fold metallo-hydrolase [Nitrospirales bacterium]